MAWTTNKTDAFRLIAERIRSLFPLFNSNRSNKRLEKAKASTPKYIIDLATVDIPQKSLVDEIFWDMLPGRLENTATARGGTEDISRAPPHHRTNILDNPATNEVFWDALNGSEARSPVPLFNSALIPTSGLLMNILDKESLSEYIG